MSTDSSFNSWIDEKDLAKYRIKISKYFLSRLNHLVEILTLQLIYLIIQQKQILKIFHMLILRVLNSKQI